MAFAPETLALIVQPIADGGIRFHSYHSDDSEDDITENGYFRNALAYGLRIGDLVFVVPFADVGSTFLVVVDSFDGGDATAVAAPPNLVLSQLPLSLGYVAGLNADAGTTQSSPWTGTDDSAAIQALLDKHLYERSVDSTRVPVGAFLLTRGLQVGHGVTITGARLSGAVRGYNRSPSWNGTTFFANFVDEPGISVQGIRSATLEHFSLNGPLAKFISDSGFGNNNYAGTIDDTVAANWVDTTAWTSDQLAQIRSAKAPCAGIAIDPRTGVAPTPPYRDVDLSYFGAVSQYSKLSSSLVSMEHLEISGFYVAIVVQPNSAAGNDINGDFTYFTDIRIAYCPYGIAPTQTQERGAQSVSISASNFHTLFIDKIFGRAQGKFGDQRNFVAGNGIQLYDFANPAFLGPIELQGYGEALWREGDILSASANERSFSIRAQLGFDNQNTKRGVPATICDDASAQVFPFKWDGGSRHGYRGPCVIYHPIEGVTIEGTLMDPSNAELDTGAAISTAVKTFRNGTCGGIVLPQFGLNKRIENIRPKFNPWNLDTGAQIGATMTGRQWPSNRNICTPLWVTEHFPSGATPDKSVRIPRGIRAGSINPASFGLTGTMSTGRTVSGAIPGSWSASDEMTKWGKKGDILLHEATRSVFVVTDRTGSAFTLTLQNNWRGTDPIAAIDWSASSIFIACMRWYSPQRPVYGILTSGSSIITDCGIYSTGGLTAGLYSPSGTQDSSKLADDLGEGDYLVIDESLLTYMAQADAFIAAGGIDETAKTITISGNALASSTTRVRLGTWSRVAP